jgi:serine/threonine-protein kinase
MKTPIEPYPNAEQPFSPGQSIGGRFRILREVGRGGMGVVYEALDEKLDRRVAVKCAKPGHHASLPPEARAASEVSHYNVCKVHEIHSTATPFGDVDYLTMEFVEGETLWQRVSREGKLPDAEAREIARQLCAGLAQAHKQGVIHGDLKCPNVILTRSQSGEARAVLTDFGLARSQSGEGSPHVMNRHGGTLEYMAPELFQGARASIASDIYALGVLFHVMLTGRAPQRLTEPHNAILSVEPHGSTATMIETEGVETERQIGKLPARWRLIVKRCLAATPAKRFESAEQVCLALEPRRKFSGWIPVLALGLIAASGVAIWQNREPDGEHVRLAVFPALVQGRRSRPRPE